MGSHWWNSFFFFKLLIFFLADFTCGCNSLTFIIKSILSFLLIRYYDIYFGNCLLLFFHVHPSQRSKRPACILQVRRRRSSCYNCKFHHQCNYRPPVNSTNYLCIFSRKVRSKSLLVTEIVNPDLRKHLRQVRCNRKLTHTTNGTEGK